ncbi:MAG: hypothetical protein M1476_05760 [Candidatus Thermoplasmatota archaeon]|nr:hypothetical protein [Candidatus Thermoplasmatota archaeon]
MELKDMGGDEIFVCDYDAIQKGRFNFRMYVEISKFFELILMNQPGRVEDFMDSIISGASRVVIRPNETAQMLTRMLEFSPEIVMPANGTLKVKEFLSLGGEYLISDHEVSGNFALCYLVARIAAGEKYVQLINFPEDMLPYLS